MNDVALRRRVAALVIAALLAVSGAALASAFIVDDAQAIVGTKSADTFALLHVNDGDALNG